MEEKKKKILIVEDESLLAMLMEERLSKSGYRVVGTASRGKKAIEYAEKHSPDLIIMDIFLKGPMDGVQAAEHINNSLDIPIIFVTGNTDSGTYARAMKTRHYGYHEKPMPIADLIKAVEDTLELIRFEKDQEKGNDK